MAKIRFATKKDLPAIMAVMDDVKYLQFRFGKNYDPDKVKLILESEFSNRSFLVAIENDQIIGYAIFGDAEAFLKCPIKLEMNKRIYSLGTGVLAAYQGKGIGLMLKKFTEKVAKDEGCKGMFTDVSSTNHESLKHQIRAGFKEIVRYKDKKRTFGQLNVLFYKEF